MGRTLRKAAWIAGLAGLLAGTGAYSGLARAQDGTGGDGGAGAGELACERVEVSSQPAPTSVLIVLDSSRSMYQVEGEQVVVDRWNPAVDAIETVTTALEGSIQFGLALFPGDDMCGAGEVVVPVAPTNAAGVSAALAGDPFETTGGGTPTATSLEAAEMALADVTGERHVLLVTDGAPNCNPDLDVNSCECVAPSGTCADSLNCLDDTRTIAAIEALASAGIGTYVIGFDTSEWREVLDRMAEAGGTERSTHISVTDGATLESALRDVVGSTVPCSYELGFPPEDASLVEVAVDGQDIDHTSEPTAEGWTLSGDTTVELRGQACAIVQDGEEHEVVITACALDADGDGLSDEDEVNFGTDPDVADTDGDGFSDGEEVAAGTDPLDPEEFPVTEGLRGGGGPAGGCGVQPARSPHGVPSGAVALASLVLLTLRRKPRPRRP